MLLRLARLLRLTKPRPALPSHVHLGGVNHEAHVKEANYLWGGVDVPKPAMMQFLYDRNELEKEMRNKFRIANARMVKVNEKGRRAW